MKPLESRNLDSIQMFRGIAAMMVVVFHFREVLPSNYNSFLGHFIIRGYSGVDLFFVISGFIAYYTVENCDYSGEYKGLHYLFKRIAKIIPLYYLFTFMSAGHTYDSLYQTLKSLCFIPLGLGREGPIYGGARVGQGWTLNYEFYFYLMVSLSFLFGKFKWVFTIGMILLLIFIPAMILPLPKNYLFEGFNFNLPYLGLITNPINIEFIIGIAVGFIYSKMKEKGGYVWYAVSALIGIGFMMNYYNPFIYSSRISAWAIPAALLILSFLKLEKARLLKVPNIMKDIGNRSFSIYIIHAGVIGAITKIASHTFHNKGGEYTLLTGIALFFIALSITLLLSEITYRKIEKNISCRLRSWLTSRSLFFKRPNLTKHGDHF